MWRAREWRTIPDVLMEQASIKLVYTLVPSKEDLVFSINETGG
jgi:hypothetical protein